jgi:threonylcarbamoyladenosine tRNA methylthiotransferase MtaB
VPDGLAAADREFGISTFGGRVRAFLKIQEGCDFFCSYCILPHVRGEPRSRALADVAAEARRLADAGFPEVVLTGIHVGLYGRDLPERPTVAQAILAVAGTQGVSRVRLSSIEPNEVDEELLEALRHPAACPHLHLPLQSGDADVLRRMNRRYTPDEFRAAVGRARARLDRPAITTDVIVGFPGESEAEFANTLAFCREIGFSRLHVFPFSPRPGTPAAEMGDQVPARVAQERSRRLRDLGDAMAGAWAEGFVGRTVRCLFERVTPEGLLAGYSDRYVTVTAAGPADLVGRTHEVKCTGREGTALMGELGRSNGREP